MYLIDVLGTEAESFHTKIDKGYYAPAPYSLL